MTYPLPPYLANLVVSEEPVDPTSVEATYHVLRPYGGTACLEVAQRDAFDQATAGLIGADVRWTHDTVLLSRQGALPDSADWTHSGADAANSGASQERSLTTPLAVLWFDGSLRWNRQPGNPNEQPSFFLQHFPHDRAHVVHHSLAVSSHDDRAGVVETRGIRLRASPLDCFRKHRLFEVDKLVQFVQAALLGRTVPL